RAARPQYPQGQALEPGLGGQARVESRVGGGDPGASTAELDLGDPSLGRELRDERIGVAERPVGDLLAGEIAEIVEDGGQLVAVAGPAVGRRLLQLRLD